MYRNITEDDITIDNEPALPEEDPRYAQYAHLYEDDNQGKRRPSRFFDDGVQVRKGRRRH